MSWYSVLGRLYQLATERPDAVVLVQGGQRVSYTQLYGEVVRVGSALMALGARHERVVGVAMGRCVDHVTACLGAWHAGAAFLPLDPAWSDDRLSNILAEARPIVVLTTPEQRERFLALYPHVAAPSELGDAPRQSLPAFSIWDLAYLSYDTGPGERPAGVEVRHIRIHAAQLSQIELMRLSRSCRVLWHHGPADHGSIADVLTSLLAGATLIVEREDLPADALAQRLRDHRITHVRLSPAHLLIPPDSMPDSLDTVLIHGIECFPELVRAWAKRFRVVSAYAPPEMGGIAAQCVCKPGDWNRPLVGRPTSGLAYHVMREGRYMPLGEAGELHIGGTSAARGYRERPGLTAERFVTSTGSDRLFRTGLWVRQRTDGSFLLVSRAERTIRIGGGLLEPEDVEDRLYELPGVREAFVTERAGEVVAFVTGEVPPDRDVRGHLARWFPASLQPRQFVRLEALPRAVNDLIDVDALLSMPLPAEPVAAFGGTLGDVLDLASAVLGHPAGPDACFLEQGGDSLGLLRVVAAGCARGWAIPPALLASQSLRDVADFIDRPRSQPGVMSATALRQDVGRLAATLPEGQGGAFPGQASAILLTGATGFLGSHLLQELLRQTEVEVVCLVRDKGTKAGLERLFNGLARRGVSLRTDERRRVGVIAGDVRLPDMGLPQAAWRELGRRVDAVYHAAAQVDLVRSYAALCHVNVAGTYQVLRLCREGRAKWLHHVSAMSVVIADGRSAAREEDDLSQTEWVRGGYAQSKWAAEWLARHGPGATIYRPSLLGPAARGGHGPEDGMLAMLVRGIASVGCLPRDARELRVNVLPVDHAAKAIVHLSLHATERSPAFHVAALQSLTLADLVAALCRAGVRVEEDSDGWERRLTALNRDEAAAWLALCGGLDLFDTASIDTTQARRALVGSGAELPLADEAMADRIVAAALG